MSNKTLRDVAQDVKDIVSLNSSKIIESAVSGINTITVACEEAMRKQNDEIIHLRETVAHLLTENEGLRKFEELVEKYESGEIEVATECVPEGAGSVGESLTTASKALLAMTAEKDVYKGEVERLNSVYSQLAGSVGTLQLLKTRSSLRNGDGTFFYEWIRLNLAMTNEANPTVMYPSAQYLAYDMIDFILLEESDMRNILISIISHEIHTWFVIESSVAALYPDLHAFIEKEFIGDMARPAPHGHEHIPSVHDAVLVQENVPTTLDADPDVVVDPISELPAGK